MVVYKLRRIEFQFFIEAQLIAVKHPLIHDPFAHRRKSALSYLVSSNTFEPIHRYEICFTSILPLGWEWLADKT